MASHFQIGNPVHLTSGPRRAKRLKIDIACDTCRSRKVKCDGLRPACGNCSKRVGQKDKCRYSHSDGTTAHAKVEPSGKDHGNSLIGHNGSQYRSPLSQPPPVAVSPPHAAQNSHGAYASQTPPGLRPVLPVPSPARHALDRSSMPRSQGAASEAGSAHKPDRSPNVIDSMTAVVGDGVNTGEFFGSSSAGSFTAQIKAAIGSRLGHTQASSSPGSNRGATNLNAARREGTRSNMQETLPIRRQADHLMQIYWFYVDPLYPFIDKRKWDQNYSNLFAGIPLDTDESIFVATLNVIFALSTQLVEAMTAENRDETAEVYFKRAQDALSINLLDSGSIELIQCLLLTSQYLQCTNLPHQTWMIVGSAVRVAQSLGLHLPETSAEQPTVAQCETLRRLWHGCVLMDRMVALTHGRPAMVSRDLATAVPLPRTSSNATPDEYGRLTEASFFVKSVELYEITHRVTLELYSEPGSRIRCTVHTDSPDEDLSIVMQLDGAMMKWEASLPKHLDLSDPDAAANDVSHRQAVILYIRFLHARMLLLRPILARVCLPHQPSDNFVASPNSLQSTVMKQCAVFCVDVARKIVASLLKYQAYDGTVGLLPAWWYRVYYLFSAATVLIAARLRADMFDVDQINGAWDELMQVLRSHEHVSESARRCVAALQILSSKILQSVPSTKSTGTGGGSDSQPVPSAPYMGTSEPTQTAGVYHRDAGQTFVPFPDIDVRNLTFNVDDFSWLNDMNAWNVINK